MWVTEWYDEEIEIAESKTYERMDWKYDDNQVKPTESDFTVYAKRKLFISYTFFKHRAIHQYTWRGHERDRQSMIDYVIITVSRDERLQWM